MLCTVGLLMCYLVSRVRLHQIVSADTGYWPSHIPSRPDALKFLLQRCQI